MFSSNQTKQNQLLNNSYTGSGSIKLTKICYLMVSTRFGSIKLIMLGLDLSALSN
ncbi:hypothetical protein MELB17_09973 [Marinobacter sp. ELB17]|nr:hypothetical protein MELB17_09973 [Marinobacter sp. ELB17]